MIVDGQKIVVRGNIYTDMPFEPALLEDNGITIHAKRDVFFGIDKEPNRMKTEDYYFSYVDFIKRYGPIKDIIAFSNI
jgi:hypothetical protein